MSNSTYRFQLTNERAVVGRVVFLDRGQVGVITEVVPPAARAYSKYERQLWVDPDEPPVLVKVAWGVKGRVKTFGYADVDDDGEQDWLYRASELGDYDPHLAARAALVDKLMARRGKYPGALPFGS